MHTIIRVVMKKNRIYPSITGYCSKICKAASYASLGGSFGSACSVAVTKFYKLDINFISGKWYFVTKIVLTYCEQKIVLVIEKKI